MTKKVWIVGWLIALLLLSNSAMAQLRAADNEGVVLYLSLAPEIAYNDTTTFRGESATPSPAEAMVTSEPSPEPQIAYVLAAYPPEAIPELQVVTFGLRYPSGIRIVRHGITHQSLPMATRDWPLSGEGIAIGLLEPPDTSRVVEIGWIAIRADKPGRVEIVPHPEPKMGCRVVCSTPPSQVPVAQYGWLGFGEEGFAPEPTRPGPRWGAACVQDTVCMHLTDAEAGYYDDLYQDKGGVLFLGVGSSCRTGTPCAIEAEAGACCLPDGACVRITQRDCAVQTGRYQGDGSRCSPDPCGADSSRSEEE